MATAALSLSSTARVAPAAPSRSKRSVARPVRARAVATKAEGEISGLSEDGQWQELCRAEIPGKLPRHDFLRQLYRYFVISYQDNGLAQYGKRMEVELIDGDDDLTNGMLVNIYGNVDGEEKLICPLHCEMDTEMVPTFDTLMPNPEGEIIKSNRSGKDEFVKGRYFMIRRPVPFDESSNAALKQMIKDMTLAINKYYAFGSCFSDDN